MNFGVVGSAGIEGVDIDGYILPDASHIVTDGRNEIGRRAIDYAARRKISCKIEADKRKLMESVDAIIMFWKSLDEELTEYMRDLRRNRRTQHGVFRQRANAVQIDVKCGKGGQCPPLPL